MHVLATAGHVDHGKSTLVRALTGQDPDRLTEERRRGLSIQLGYCWTFLPGAGDVAFVDVPGHERFITTTLAGMGPVLAALLVVAADDPWMPQAAEHLAALNALGVEHALLVVTRRDLADPGPAMARARAELDRTSLRGAVAVAVSGRTGEGLEDLRRELTSMLIGLPVVDPSADVRLWVDRRFHVRGTGTVVTGTLTAGTIRTGDSLLCDGVSVRVRALESLGKPTTAVHGVARVALALAGGVPESLGPGSALVSPGAFEYAGAVDVRLTGEGRVPQQPVLHVGSASLGVHVRPLAGDLHRLTLGYGLPLRLGDRALIRDPGSRRVWGLSVLDPAPPSLGRRGAAAARAASLATADGTMGDELSRRGLAEDAWLRRLGATGETPRDALAVGPWLVAAERVNALRADLVRHVAENGSATRPGVPVAQVAQALGLPDEQLVPALVQPPLVLHHGVVKPTTSVLPPELGHALSQLQERLEADPFSSPGADCMRELGLTPADLGALVRRGDLLRLAEGVVLLPGADDHAVDLLAELGQPFSVSQARAHLGSSRRVVIPLLAHLDRKGRTMRLPDDTRRLREPET